MAGADSVVHDWTKQVLGTLTERYHIEYGGFLSNHISHGIYALYYLGADIPTIQKYVDYYTDQKLETQDKANNQHLGPGESLNDLSQYKLGSRVHFYALKRLIRKEIDDNNGDYTAVIRTHFPKLADGLPGSLIHCLIQLGYGIALECRDTVVEGLSYFYHSYVSVYMGDPDTQADPAAIGQFGKGTETLLDVLKDVKNETQIAESMSHEELNDAEVITKDFRGFQRGLFVQYKYKTKEIQSYVDRIKLPEGTDLENPDISGLCNWLIDAAILVYSLDADVMNDFVLVHGVTGAWSLKQILLLMTDKPEVCIRAIRSYLILLISVYIRLKKPTLDVSLIQTIPDGTTVNQAFWEQLNTELRQRQCDEHYYKLHQVLYSQWKENPEKKALYVSAAKRNMNNEMSIGTTKFPRFNYN